MDYFIHYLNTQGIIYYDWNVSAGDGASTAYTSEEIVENVTDDVVNIKRRWFYCMTERISQQR